MSGCLGVLTYGSEPTSRFYEQFRIASYSTLNFLQATIEQLAASVKQVGLSFELNVREQVLNLYMCHPRRALCAALDQMKLLDQAGSECRQS
jgi:hypothetical protein